MCAFDWHQYRSPWAAKILTVTANAKYPRIQDPLARPCQKLRNFGLDSVSDLIICRREIFAVAGPLVWNSNYQLHTDTWVNSNDCRRVLGAGTRQCIRHYVYIVCFVQIILLTYLLNSQACGRAMNNVSSLVHGRRSSVAPEIHGTADRQPSNVHRTLHVDTHRTPVPYAHTTSAGAINVAASLPCPNKTHTLLTELTWGLNHQSMGVYLGGSLNAVQAWRHCPLWEPPPSHPIVLL